MYELFLTSTVKDEDFAKASAVLQGLSWMTARQSVQRILFYAGQPQPRGLPNHQSFQQSRMIRAWGELHKQLCRSSYILQIVYDVWPDTDFGKEGVVDFNRLPGTLKWTDLPDPLRDSPITQRKKIDIPDQLNLPQNLAENGLEYKNEMIQESYSYVRTNVEFVFTRYYYIPPSNTPGQPSATLPAWSELKPVDPARKWGLNVKLFVTEDNQPDKIQKGNEELLRVKAELEKLFEFNTIDRKVFDTRIPPPPMNHAPRAP